MWYRTVVFFLPFVLGMEEHSMKFAIDYFTERNVKFVCLLACENDAFVNIFMEDLISKFGSGSFIQFPFENSSNSQDEPFGSHKFAKYAIKADIAIAEVRINDLNDIVNEEGIHQCLEHHVGVLINLKCMRNNEILNFRTRDRLFDSVQKWLLIGETTNSNNAIYTNTDEGYKTGLVYNNYHAIYKSVDEANETELATDDWVSALNGLDMSLDADVVFSLQRGAEYCLYDVYNIGKIQGGKVNIQEIGSWNPETALNIINLNSYKYYRRWDFQQWSMRMTVVMTPPPTKFDPQMIIGRQPTAGVAVITQTSAMVLESVAEIHNFRYNYTITDMWIKDFSPNTSKVVASSLYYHDQDVSPVLRFMKETHDKVDFVHPPLTSIETRYYYRIPTNGAGKFENQFLRPLTSGAWGCVAAVVVLCALVLLMAAKLERRPSSVQYAVFSVLASFCQQFFDSGDQDTRAASAARKLTVLVTGVSCLLIYNYYTSSVVSWLLNGPPPSINSLQELLESPLELVFEDIGYTHSWLQVPTYYYNKRNAEVEDEMKRKKVFNKKADAPLLVSLEEGSELLKAGGYAFHTEADSANLLISRKFTQSELCELGSLQSMEKTVLYAPVQKNSPYKEFLIWSLARLNERGIVTCIQHRMRSAAFTCEGSSPRPLALGGAAPAFLLLATGSMLAATILICEMSPVHRIDGVPLTEQFKCFIHWLAF